MKRICFLLLLLSGYAAVKAQQSRFASEIQALVSAIEATKSAKIYTDTITICDGSGNLQPSFQFRFIADSATTTLLKAVVNNLLTKTSKTYYFNSDWLIQVTERSENTQPAETTKYFFTDADFSIGNTYKDYATDTGVHERERLLADAYKIRHHYKSVVK